jgi:hypothetical protein
MHCPANRSVLRLAPFPCAGLPDTGNGISVKGSTVNGSHALRSLYVFLTADVGRSCLRDVYMLVKQ